MNGTILNTRFTSTSDIKWTKVMSTNRTAVRWDRISFSFFLVDIEGSRLMYEVNGSFESSNVNGMYNESNFYVRSLMADTLMPDLKPENIMFVQRPEKLEIWIKPSTAYVQLRGIVNFASFNFNFINNGERVDTIDTSDSLTSFTPDIITSRWENLTLTNGWSNYDSSLYNALSFKITNDSQVHLKGLVKSSKTTSSTFGETLAILPEKARPYKNIILSGTCYASDFGISTCRINITPQGSILPFSDVPNANSLGRKPWSYLSLEGLSFWR